MRQSLPLHLRRVSRQFRPTLLGLEERALLSGSNLNPMGLGIYDKLRSTGTKQSIAVHYHQEQPTSVAGSTGTFVYDASASGQAAVTSGRPIKTVHSTVTASLKGGTTSTDTRVDTQTVTITVHLAGDAGFKPQNLTITGWASLTTDESVTITGADDLLKYQETLHEEAYASYTLSVSVPRGKFSSDITLRVSRSAVILNQATAQIDADDINSTVTAVFADPKGGYSVKGTVVTSVGETHSGQLRQSDGSYNSYVEPNTSYSEVRVKNGSSKKGGSVHLNSSANRHILDGKINNSTIREDSIRAGGTVAPMGNGGIIGGQILVALTSEYSGDANNTLPFNNLFSWQKVTNQRQGGRPAYASGSQVATIYGLVAQARQKLQQM